MGRCVTEAKNSPCEWRSVQGWMGHGYEIGAMFGFSKGFQATVKVAANQVYRKRHKKS